ncbi:hypothetical protein PIB30_048652 [Stylosanthes scabra]|uniref:Uncharacterized protein n=1 Tax=Stylosanthes scabra TaxID=79078 RepID=A0ABU6WI57_9FABA|nr:hypothetical protein [Stylosanthes scabra]
MLALLLRLIIFSLLTLWSFLTRLIFSSIASTIVLLIQAIKVPSEAIHGGFQLVAEALRACLEAIFQLIIEAINLLLSSLFDAIKESIKGSMSATGSAIGEVAEKLKTSIEEGLQNLPELIEDLTDFASKVVQELWNNYVDSVAQVMENNDLVMWSSLLSFDSKVSHSDFLLLNLGTLGGGLICIGIWDKQLGKPQCEAFMVNVEAP